MGRARKGYRVIAGWTASYADPIGVAAGAPLHLTGRTELWDGHLWLWARSRDGREGWLPDSLVARGPGGARAREAYSAVELDCEAGQILIGEAEVHGWIWCHAADGAAGWVPARNLAALDGEERAES